MKSEFLAANTYPAERAAGVFASIRAGKHRHEVRRYNRSGDAFWVSREPVDDVQKAASRNEKAKSRAS